MLTFPDPSVETEYTDPNGSVWEFNGTGWVRQCDCPDGGYLSNTLIQTNDSEGVE